MQIRGLQLVRREVNSSTLFLVIFSCMKRSCIYSVCGHKKGDVSWSIVWNLEWTSGHSLGFVVVGDTTRKKR